VTPCSDNQCPGTVMDGFCDVCGMAPQAEAAVPEPAPPEPASAGVAPGAPSLDIPAPAGLAGAGGTGAVSGAMPATPPSGSGPRISMPSQGLGTPSTPSGRVSARTGASSSARGMLGAGMVHMPIVPYRDPATAVMENPEVPEKDRFCGNCQDPVGRSREGRPGRTEGFCRSCGHRFSFTPKLKPGDRVQGQYEVLGCLAHGGLGWIYLARDLNVDNRWVVLKGLLNTGDLDAYQGAAAERAFLAGVEHPNIVKIYNFVRHPDPVTGVDSGYIVMEYVGGKSLKELLVDRRSVGDGSEVLPLAQVIAYGLEVLRALGYLHGQGLLFCDFKPDNVIQSEEVIKLIDLGGVRRLDDDVSPVYATPGYRVPEDELRDPGPMVSSDLYTVGRALAVLSFKFSFHNDYPHQLPPRRSIPLLAEHESFARFLSRATDREPARRFADAGDMAEQLTGVLREVLATQDGVARPAASTLFGPERFFAAGPGALGEADRLLDPPQADAAAAMLPVPLVAEDDDAADLLAGFAEMDPADLLQTLRVISESTPETRLMQAWALIRLGEAAQADQVLDEAFAKSPQDWRISWYRALLAMRVGDAEDARRRFDALYDYLPGEVAPKLGLALACELGGLDGARYFETVWVTDNTYVSAAFGLARTRLDMRHDRGEAVRVLDSVPQLSSLYLPAQQAAISARIVGADRVGGQVSEEDLRDAAHRLQRLDLGGELHHRIASRVLHAALEWWEAGGRPASEAPLLSGAFTEEGIREDLEESYRGLARYVSDLQERYALIDQANAIRPTTLV
jgi:serine/threonine-protein kinase PknG